MRTCLVFTAALTFASVALADKEDDCRDECKALTDADLKAACLKWIEPFRRDNGCLGGKFTDVSCCTERRELLKKLHGEAAALCGTGSDAKKCLEPFSSVCLAMLPAKDDKFEKCVKKEVLAPAQGKALAAQCDTLPEVDRAICGELTAYAAKDDWSPESLAKAIKQIGAFLALCDKAFDRGACEKAHVACHDKWKSNRFDFYNVKACYEVVAGRYAYCMGEIEKYFLKDDKSTVVRDCEQAAKDDKLSAAEKAKIKEVCDEKIQLLTTKETADKAAQELRNNLLPRIEGNYKPNLAQKTLLSMKAEEIKRTGEECLAAVKTVQEVRKLGDADPLLEFRYNSKDAKVTVAEARAICQWPLDNVEVMVKAIKEANAAFAAEKIKDFCDQHGCKGKAQKATLDELIKGNGVKIGPGTMEGTPSSVKKKGGQIYWTWVWKSSSDVIMCSCDHIVFDGGGSKVVKKFNERCRCSDW